MSQQRVTWDCQWSGQRRAYADTTTEGVITIEKNFLDQGWEPWDTIGIDYAKKLAKGFVFFVERDESTDWFEPYLTTFEEIGPGQFKILVTRRYDD